MVNTFKELNDLNLILKGKIINCINEYNAINAFMENWSWASSIQKRNTVSFSKLYITLEKKQIEFKGELKVEVEGHPRF